MGCSKDHSVGHMIAPEQDFKGNDHISMPDDIQAFLSPHLCYTSFAGNISISMPDTVKLVQYHFKGLQGRDNHLQASTYVFKLRGLPRYAMG